MNNTGNKIGLKQGTAKDVLAKQGAEAACLIRLLNHAALLALDLRCLSAERYVRKASAEIDRCFAKKSAPNSVVVPLIRKNHNFARHE